MALCGAALPDEKKDGDFGDEHSLDNIVAFSTKKRQMCAPNKEGLMRDENGTPVDRRIKICFDDEKFFSSSYARLCQVTALVPGGKKGVGSGFFRRTKEFYFIVTCAHNLVAWSSLRKCAVPFKNLRTYGMRDGKNNWLFLSKGHGKKLAHPKYNGQPDCGYDLGIILTRKKPKHLQPLLSNYNKLVKNKDTHFHAMNPKDIVKGMTIELAGYPGEKKGYPYTHTGKIVAVVESDLGGWVLWYNADATPGNSGSPIILTDEKYVKTHALDPRVTKLVIGSHTGHDEAEGCNFGTLLTPSLEKWMGEELKLFLSE